MTDILTLVYQNGGFDEQEMVQIKNAHYEVRFKKGENILSFGGISDGYYIVKEGILRSYVIDFNHEEMTTEFYCQGDIVIEVVSLFQQKSSESCIQALSEVVLYKIPFPVFQQLFLTLKGFSNWGRNWMTEELFKLKQRHIHMITQTAAERYIKLGEEKPDIIQKAPLKHIASHLGIKNTSLSRLRRDNIKKK